MANGLPDQRADGVFLGPLRESLPFLTRALRAYIRAENAEFYTDFAAEQGEIVVLSVIGLNPGISQNDLAATLVFKKSAVTKLVKGLEDRGLVERAKVAADKRFNALTLSPAGQAKYLRINERMTSQNDAFLEAFTPEEKSQLFTYLNRLHSHLADRHAQRTGSPSVISGAGDD
jgi:DNA-binding MarR family transcriptional regulator